MGKPSEQMSSAKLFLIVAGITVLVVGGIFVIDRLVDTDVSFEDMNPFTHSERRQREERMSATIQANILAMRNPTPAPSKLAPRDNTAAVRAWHELRSRGMEMWERCESALEMYRIQKRVNPSCAQHNSIRGETTGATINARDWMREVFKFCGKNWFYQTKVEPARADRYLETSLCDFSEHGLLQYIHDWYEVGGFLSWSGDFKDVGEFEYYRDWWESERRAK